MCGFSHQRNEFQRGKKKFAFRTNSWFLLDLIWINLWTQEQLLLFVYWKFESVIIKICFWMKCKQSIDVKHLGFWWNLVCTFYGISSKSIRLHIVSRLYSLIGNNRIKLFCVVAFSLLHTIQRQVESVSTIIGMKCRRMYSVRTSTLRSLANNYNWSHRFALDAIKTCTISMQIRSFVRIDIKSTPWTIQPPNNEWYN